MKQAGSLVAPNHLRFDFSHFTGVADEELQDIEDIINKEVLSNEKIEVIENVPIDVAINEYNAMALFGEKYGDKVRVIKIGDFSTELCGGTHTAQTGEIGLIKVLKEGSVSSGVRRIEAVTGEGSLHHFRKDHQLENVVASFAGPALSQRTRKDGAPEETFLSPAEALKAELEKKDAEIKRLARELDQVADEIGIVVRGHRQRPNQRGARRESPGPPRGQSRARADAHAGRSIARQAGIGRGGAGLGHEWQCFAYRRRHQGPYRPHSGGQSHRHRWRRKSAARAVAVPISPKPAARTPDALDAALGEVYGVVEGLLGK